MYRLSSSFKQDDPFVGNGIIKTPSNKYGSIEYNAFKPCEIMDGAAINELGRNDEEPRIVAIGIENEWVTIGD